MGKTIEHILFSVLVGYLLISFIYITAPLLEVYVTKNAIWLVILVIFYSVREKNEKKNTSK